ncbi:MAG: carbohydrate-binding protein, partial [Nitrospirota bacterium]
NGKWREPEIVDSTGDVGQYVSLRISRDRRHHVVYYDADHGNLKYTYKSNPDSVGGWATPTILDASGDVGRHAVMAIGPSGSLHVVYYDADKKDLKYVTNDDTHGWTAPVVLDAVGDVGTYASMSVYYEGWTEKMNGAYEGHYPHITYYDASNGNLKYIYQDDQGWSTPLVLDAAGDVGQYTSTAFGPDGALHVAYYDATNKDLKYLHKEAGSATWPVGIVLDAEGDVGRFASLGVTARGYPNIAYYDADNQILKFLSKTKTTAPQWDNAQVIATGSAGQYASLVTSGFVDIADLDGWELYNDGDVAVRVMDVSGWPYESGMAVNIMGGPSEPDHDFIQFLKRTDDDHGPPQIFVLYANGYARIITQPPVGREERVCFGSSMIIGPAAEDPLFPFIPIEKLDIDPQTMTIKVRYKNGSSAVLQLQAEPGKTTVRVTDVTYDTLTAPFVTMRSMWVANDNSDISRIQAASSSGVVQTYPIDPTHEEWTTIPGDSWSFDRPTYSRHNTSCPDFKIDVLGPRGYLVTQQAEDYRSGTLMKAERKTASGGQTVQGTGEANYVLNLTEDIANPSIRLRYTKGQGAGDHVNISVDGRRQSTVEMIDVGALGDYEMTNEMRLSQALPAGSHTIKLEVQSNTGALELDYFVIHSQADHPSQ